MKKKQGISLIVLVITIIVMIILAAAVIVSLDNTGIINSADDAMVKTSIKNLQQEAEIVKLLEFGNHVTNNRFEEKMNKNKLLTKLNEHFKNSTRVGDRIITSNGKYAIIVLDDLRIIVTKNEKIKDGKLVLTATFDETSQDVPYSVFITPIIGGYSVTDDETGETYETYDEYATAVLESITSDNELEQIFVDGINYWNVENLYYEPIYENIDELVATWSERSDYGPFETVEEMYKANGFTSFREMAIAFEAVKPEGYYGIGYLEYAKNVLATTTKSKEQLYMEGELYIAQSQGRVNEAMLKATTFEELVYATYGFENITTVTELYEYLKEISGYSPFDTVEEMMIVWNYVEREAYDMTQDEGTGSVLIQCSDGQVERTISGETVEFTLKGLMEYTFYGTTSSGETASISVKKNITDETVKSKVYYGNSSIVPTNPNFFEYEYDASTRTAKIIGAKEAYAESSYYASRDGTITKLYTVGLIDESGKSITDIVIPYETVGEDGNIYTVTSIGTFFNSDMYEHIEPGMKYTSVILPSTITEIENRAFFGCTNLEYVRIPSSVKSIGDSAFEHCNSLVDINIEEGVKTIGRYTFSRCDKLENIELPSTLTSIGARAFYICTKLTDIKIPTGVKTIDDYTFAYCNSLRSIVIPSTVTNINEYAFYNVYLRDVYYTGTSSQWSRITIGTGNSAVTGVSIKYNYVVN